MISDKAVVSPKAKIGQNVTIFPFAYIEDDVVIGDDCIIYPYVSVMNGTRMGRGNKIHQNTVLGAIPQDFNYRGEATTLVIGNDNIIRENVVINRATFATGETRIGDSNFIMEGVHISHDAHIGHRCVFGYGTKIAGDTEFQNAVILSSNVIINPGCRVGVGSMISSGCRVSYDVPPYIVADGNPVVYGVDSTRRYLPIMESMTRHSTTSPMPTVLYFTARQPLTTISYRFVNRYLKERKSTTS